MCSFTFVVCALLCAGECQQLPLTSISPHSESFPADLWQESLKYGAKTEEAARRLVFLEMEICPMDPPYLRAKVATWKSEGIRVVPLIIHLLESKDLWRISSGSAGNRRALCHATLLQWLAASADPRATDYLIRFAERQLERPLQSEADLSFLRELFLALGVDGSDPALDILFNIIRKDSRDPIPDVSAIVEDRGYSTDPKKDLKAYAVNALEYSGTKRAMHAFATGEGIPHFLASHEGYLDGCFKRTVRAYVGLYGMPPEWYGEELPQEKLAIMEGLYKQYGKEYLPEKRKPGLENLRVD